MNIRHGVMDLHTEPWGPLRIVILVEGLISRPIFRFVEMYIGRCRIAISCGDFKPANRKIIAKIFSQLRQCEQPNIITLAIWNHCSGNNLKIADSNVLKIISVFDNFHRCLIAI